MAYINGNGILINANIGATFVGEEKYDPTSINAQSGKAVAEAISTKANLQFKTLDIEEFAYVNGLKEGAHIYELKEIRESGSSSAYELFFADGTQLIASADGSFKVGKKYLISTTLNPETGYVFDIVAEVIDLEDKVNIVDIDQTYSPESPNAQSGIAVAEAVSTKANIEFAPIDIGENVSVWDWRSEDGIYTLEHIDEPSDIGEDVGAYTLAFDNSNIAFAIRTTLTDFAKLGFVVGKDYKLTYTDVVNGKVERVIDLKDKVNIEDIDQSYNPESPNAQSGIAVAEALASVPSGGSGEYILLCETTITAEDISEAGENGITRLVVGGEEEQFKGVRELVLDLYMPANDQKNFRFYAGFSTDGTSNISDAKLIGGHTDGILPIDTTKRTRTKLVTILNGSGKFMYSLLIGSVFGSSVYPNPSVGCVSYLNETAGMGNCNYIYCNGDGFKFPEGTIFKVYGRY